MINKQLKFAVYSFLITAFVFIVIVRNCQSSEKTEDDAQNISFNWSIVHVDKNGQQEILNIKNDTSLSSGDLFKIFVQPVKNAYVYIYLLDSAKNLTLIFPHNIDDMDNNYLLGTKYSVPEGDGWFPLDENKGIETFYLLASSKRLYTLETLTKEYANTSGNAKESVKAKILSEIKNIMWSYNPIATNIKKPFAVTGNVRALTGADDFADNAVQVKAKSFYGKVFRMEHK